MKQLPDLEVTAKSPDYIVRENEVTYVKDGKKLFTTEDKFPEVFKAEYELYKNPDIRDQIIKEKYKVQKKGTTYTQTQKRQNELMDKINNYKPRKSVWDQK